MTLTTIINDLFTQYREFNAFYPILGSIATAQVIFPMADALSQLITDKHVDGKKVRYTAFLSPLYGLMSYGVMRTGNLVGEHINSHPLAMAALGPNIWGNVQNMFFFVNNTVGEKSNYSISRLWDHYVHLHQGESSPWQNLKENFFCNIPKKEYYNATLTTLTAWNAIQYMNYAYVPEEMQTPAALCAALIWTPILSWWSLRGRRKVVGNNPAVVA